MIWFLSILFISLFLNECNILKILYIIPHIYQPWFDQSGEFDDIDLYNDRYLWTLFMTSKFRVEKYVYLIYFNQTGRFMHKLTSNWPQMTFSRSKYIQVWNQLLELIRMVHNMTGLSSVWSIWPFLTIISNNLTSNWPQMTFGRSKYIPIWNQLLELIRMVYNMTGLSSVWSTWPDLTIISQFDLSLTSNDLY